MNKNILMSAAALVALPALAFLQNVTPESQGIPSAAISEFVDACERELDGVHSFVLVRHGEIVAEGYWSPFSADRTHLLFSHSKSFTSTAAGFLVDDGKLDLDERVVDIFPEHVTEKTSENMRQIRVRDLLTMNAGQDREAEYNDVSGDWVRAFIANDTPRVPGKGFRYDSCATHVVAAIVERKTGKKLMDFLEERLFSKIGITGAWSNTSPTGVACGGWGMNMKTRDLARFGLLYLNEGRWQGEQVISRDWVRLATSLQTRTDRPGDGDWSQGYGFQFWRCRHNCFRADGAFGQYTIVMPDQDALISMTAGLSDMGKEQELVWRHLLPAMKDAPLPEDKAASDALAARCRSLAFPTVKGEVKGSASGLGRSFALEGEQKRFFFRKASLAEKGDGWEIALEGECGPQRFDVGFGKWSYGEMRLELQKFEALGALVGVQHTAASGAWTAPDTFTAKVYLVDTPMWMQFTFKFNADGTLEFTSRLWGWGGGETKLSGSLCAGAQEARWIWYPGDYGIWWGNELQSERLQWGSRLTPFWPLYEPHSRVLFRKDVKLDADEPLEVRCDGNAAVCWWDDKGGYTESSALLGKFTLPKNATSVEIKIQNNARPPSVWVKGPHLVSDSSWNVGWTTTWDKAEDVPCDSSARFTDPGTPPGLAKLPTREKKPAWCHPVAGVEGSIAAADFGEETYGYVKFLDVKGSGAVKVIYAESEAELRAVELANTNGGALDGWEMLELSETREYRREVAHGFRYVGVVRASGDVTIGAIAMDFETKAMPVRGSFRCSDEELNRIWDVSVHTLDLTCREVFIEGVKRDHWVWSGDAVQSFLMNYYVFGDYDGCRDTLWTLRGKDPVKCHLNRIMDYTFYWFDAVEKYRLYSGDPNFARQVYPRMKSLMDFALSRLDGAGRPADREGDWMFIDWAPKTLPNYGGVTSFEQMLLVRALDATAGVAREVGAKDDAESYLERAKRLRAEIVPRYWDAGKGALMHMIYNDGRVDPMVTRYPNMFGLFYGYFDEAQKASVVKNVMLNDGVMKIQTPYMRFYELEALCSLGMQKEVLKEMKSYWGGMLKLGATSFWELYNPEEKGDAHYAMYGRRFGKSLCHAWGASPVYLLGRYFLGVVPTSPGFATYDVKPNLGGLDWIEGDVPTPWGKIHVRADKNGHKVTETRE